MPILCGFQPLKSSASDKKILQALIESYKNAKNLEIQRFQGFFFYIRSENSIWKNHTKPDEKRQLMLREPPFRTVSVETEGK